MTIKEFFTTDMMENKYLRILFFGLSALVMYFAYFGNVNLLTKEGRCEWRYNRSGWGTNNPYSYSPTLRNLFIEICMDGQLDELEKVEDALEKVRSNH